MTDVNAYFRIVEIQILSVLTIFPFQLESFLRESASIVRSDECCTARRIDLAGFLTTLMGFQSIPIPVSLPAAQQPPPEFVPLAER